MADIKLEPGWLHVMAEEFSKPYMVQLKDFLRQERASGVKVFPPSPLIFNALNSTLFDDVKVVILGQDPYHGDGQAHGLSFSVPSGIAIPPSLKNIYKELEQDLRIKKPVSGDLSAWARQGVLLLNATLTVRAHVAGSHQKKGWEHFTDTIISKLSSEREGLVFMLWGSYARAKKSLIDSKKHLILESAHPSPLSAHNGFLGSGQFSKANSYLESTGMGAIDWNVY